MDLRERGLIGDLRHPWEQARARLLGSLVGSAVPHGSASVLDAGSGDAWLAWRLLDDLPVGSRITCWDAEYSFADIEELTALGPPSVDYVAEVPADDFDLVTALDVVEHVQDDGAFVRELVGRCRPGGQLLVTVPAYQRLFSAHDEALGHFRRYSPDQLRILLSSAGLTITRSGSFFQGLLLARAAMALLERRSTQQTPAESQLGWDRGPLVTRLITNLLVAEGRCARALSDRGARLPGLSTWALCTLP